MIDFLYKKINDGINSCDEEKKQLVDINAKIVNITNCISQGIFYPELKDEENKYL